MKYGLSDIVIEKIKKIFQSEPKVGTVILFGSRAKGNFKPGSDIDFALKGEKISFDDLLSLSVRLDELNLPNNIDLIDYLSLNDKDVIEHIDRIGIVFYEK